MATIPKTIPDLLPGETSPGSTPKGKGLLCRRRAWALVQDQKARIRALERQNDQQSLIIRINNLLAGQLEPERLFEAMSKALWPEIRHDFMGLSLLEPGGEFERSRFLHTRDGLESPEDSLRGSLATMPSGHAMRTGTVDLLGPERLKAVDPAVKARLERAGIQSMCCIPLSSQGEMLGCLSFGSRKVDPFTPEEVGLLSQLGAQVAVAVDNALAYRKIELLRDKLAEEKLFLEEEVRRDFVTSEIIGSSPSWKRVLNQIETVAPSDATVLLLGETGTGKELLARALHDRSQRRDGSFVKLNCSAIPLGLMESELFGHERGAFTGALARRMGRFELAHKGTIFLDEVGDLPLELQPKLLRAIQEREFERLGSNQTMKVDVRLIAATHRSLSTMVEEGRFRQDLFYRLSVFPILVPPLRERKEDIPSLVRYFAQKFAMRMDRKIERIPSATMEALVDWPWPGNIRELQNLMERSVILSQGRDLRVPLSDLEIPVEPDTDGAAATLEEIERREIRRVLRECRGVIGGPDGAAERLGLKRTTLNSRIKKLGIVRG
jgi:formate hydrogenlyase transcriptional activator